MKIALIVVAAIALGIGAVEVALRLLFGFGKPPLYTSDPQVGYRLTPHQRTRRFGNEFVINQYSMRGPAIAPEPTEGALRILLLGDSIANGGWWTDQSDILSVQLEQRLGASVPQEFQTVEVLNASANSWGPRNELAYLSKFGSFGAQVIILLINTDDLFATAPTFLPVGRDPGYPEKYPPLALIEVFSRLQKPAPIPELVALQQEGGDRVGANLEAIRQMQRLARQTDSTLIVALTPLLREVEPPGGRDYEIAARQRVAQFMADEQITFIDFLPAFQEAPTPASLYRDHIHLSVKGYALVCQTLSQAVHSGMAALPLPSTRLPDSLLDDPW